MGCTVELAEYTLNVHVYTFISMITHAILTELSHQIGRILRCGVSIGHTDSLSGIGCIFP
jgi:hypothetical protein